MLINIKIGNEVCVLDFRYNIIKETISNISNDIKKNLKKIINNEIIFR